MWGWPKGPNAVMGKVWGSWKDFLNVILSAKALSEFVLFVLFFLSFFAHNFGHLDLGPESPTGLVVNPALHFVGNPMKTAGLIAEIHRVGKFNNTRENRKNVPFV